MKRQLKKGLAIAAALLMCLSALAGCSTAAPSAAPQATTAPAATNAASATPAATDASATPAPANETNDVSSRPWTDSSIADTSDLPTWTGKKLTLTYWYAEGTGGTAKKTSLSDVVTPEIERVTGIKIDEENSFDNGGQSSDDKLNMMMAANEFPDLCWNGNGSKLIQAGKLYELTGYINATSTPTIMKKYDPKYFIDFACKNSLFNGKIWYMPFGAYESLYNDPNYDPSVDLNKYNVFLSANNMDSYPWIYVRDDILKLIYPQAHTYQELEDIYTKNGSFTKEEMLDVPINGKQDFYDFLYKVRDLNIKQDGKPVSPFFVFSGGDNWPLCAFLLRQIEGASYENCFQTYFDRKTQKIEYAFKQDEFKADMKEMNKLVLNGVASPECLVDSPDIFTQKLNSGLYAVSYAWLKPNNEQLAKDGKPYRYRKVYLNIPQDYDRYARFRTPPDTRNNLGVFVDSVSKEDLPQIMRWYDYMMSDQAEKLQCWGPKSAGLFDESNGVRTFKDQALVDNMVYGKDNDAGLKYNLSNGKNPTSDIFAPTNGFMMTFMTASHSKYHPSVTYKHEYTAADMPTFFNISFLEPRKTTLVKHDFNIWSFGDAIPDLTKANQTGKPWNEEMTKLFTAKSGDEFDKMYADWLKYVDSCGYTDDLLAQINARNVQDQNYNGVNYLDNLK